ncbi:MAG: Mut7-C RNAse domain-containing protein [Candidatus Omnitrophica bacterium]|nr:Mut7-C RNAse domain-containing protein [Candidatus Omnitrophota bacterium]
MKEIKFVVDGMLLGLGRWLRFLGCDVVFFSGRRKNFLLRLAEAEGRTILSKDTRLCAEHPERCIYVHGENIQAQLQEVRSLFLQDYRPDLYLTRCSLCNQILQKVTRESVRNQVPEYVFDHHQDFRLCPVCHRIYWDGDHARNIKKILESLWVTR